MGAQLSTTITAQGEGSATTLSYIAEFSGGGIQGPMGEMVTKKAGEEIEASLGKLRALVGGEVIRHRDCQCLGHFMCVCGQTLPPPSPFVTLIQA